VAPRAKAPQTDGGVFISEYAGDPIISSLIPRFMAEIPDRLTAITASCHNQAWSSMAKGLHQLRGAAGVYGFTYMAETAAILEESLLTASPDPEAVHKLWQRLHDFCVKLLAYHQQSSSEKV